DTTSLMTAAPPLVDLDLDEADQFVLGGHDIRRSSFQQAAFELHQRSNVFDVSLIEQCRPDLQQWDANVRPGTILGAGATIAKLAEMPEAQRADTPKQVVERVQADL